MSALTPDCDPDMAHCGQPWKGKSTTPGAGVISAVVLLALFSVSLVSVTTHAVSDAFDFVAVPVALFAGVALVRRVVRLVGLGMSAVAAHLPTAVVVRRSQPVG